MGDAAGDLFLSTLATVLNWIIYGVSNLIFALIEAVLVPILGYNNFATSRVIDLGWSLVRDVMNMGVVIILLALAIMTMLNIGKSNWRQVVPQLFIAVAAMNFSRLLCGVLIDLSQVVMFTFVNAILDIGAGNFAQLLGITNIGTLSLTSDGLGDAAINGGLMLAGAVLQLALLVAILAIMVCLAIAFLYRIVMLWVLVILSPIAFFTRFAPNVIDFPVGGKDWWPKFTATLTLGPTLAFFLWLALAISSSGNILQAEGFPEPAAGSDAFGNILDSLSSSSLTATFLALIFLVIGMEQAGKSAATMGGLAAQYINPKMGKDIVKASTYGTMRVADRLMTTSARLAAGAAGVTVGAVADIGAAGKGLVTGNGLPDDLFANTKNIASKGYHLGNIGYNSLEETAAASGKSVARSAAGAMAATGAALGMTDLAALGEMGRKKIDKKDLEIQKAAKKSVEDMTSEGRVERLAGVLANPDALKSQQEEQESHFLLADLIKNKKTQKKHLADVEARVAKLGLSKEDAGAEAQRRYNEDITTALSRFAELEESGQSDAFISTEDLQKARRQFIDLEMIRDKKSGERVIASDSWSSRDMAGRPEVLENESVRNALRDRRIFNNDGTETNELEELKKGKAGAALKAAAITAGLPKARAKEETDAAIRKRAGNDLTQLVTEPVPAGSPPGTLPTVRPLTYREVQANVEARNINFQSVSKDDIAGPNAAALVESMARRRADRSVVAINLNDTAKRDAMTGYRGALTTLEAGGMLTGAAAPPSDTLKKQARSLNDQFTLEDAEEREKGLVAGSAPIPGEIKRALGSAGRGIRAATGVYDEERTAKLIADNSRNARFVVEDLRPGATIPPAEQQKLQRIIAQEADLEDMKKVFADYNDPAKTTKQDIHRDTLEAYARSIHEEARRVVAARAAATPGVPPAPLEEIDSDLARKYNRARNISRTLVIPGLPFDPL